MFRMCPSFFVVVLCLSVAAVTVSSQQTNNDMDIPEGKLFLSEEFLSFEETLARVKESGNSFLRRGLQSSPACRAQSPLNVLRPEGQYCSALAPYPCGCSGITETACYYCAIRPEPDQITCQVSGSLITFLDHTSTVTTCGCEYLGNGQLHQFCYQNSGPVPIPPPAVVIEPAVAPIAPRAPFGSTGSFPPAPTPTTGAGTDGTGGSGGATSSGKGKGGKGGRRL
jgi:hypothetical protein